MKKHPSFPIRFSLLPAIIFLLAGPAILEADVTHTVKPGESLYAIGKKYQVNTEEILAANQLSGETIRAGQKLVVPGIEAKGENSGDKKWLPYPRGSRGGLPMSPRCTK